VVAGAGELVRNRLEGNHAVLLDSLALVPAFDGRVVPGGEVGRLDVRPAQIAIASFVVAMAFDLVVR
jgi:hypothetical protein